MSSKLSSNIVYTAIFGDYDLPQIPTVINHKIDYILFSNRHYSQSQLGPWKLYKDNVYSPLCDPRLNNRWVKILVHRWFPYAKRTLYIDGNIQMICDPLELIYFMEQNNKNSKLFVFAHDKRTCLYEEANAVISLGLDLPQTVTTQVDKYQHEGFSRNAGLAWCGVIVRKQGCDKFNEFWWQEVSRHSHRDQISFPYAAKCSEIQHTIVDYPIPFDENDRGRGANQFVRRHYHK